MFLTLAETMSTVFSPLGAASAARLREGPGPVISPAAEGMAGSLFSAKGRFWAAAEEPAWHACRVAFPNLLSRSVIRS
jgi:hypothetical protein